MFSSRGQIERTFRKGRAHRSRRLAGAGAVAFLSVALVACGDGGSPSADVASGDGSGGNPTTVEAVYAELEGLDADARMERLAELASEEDGLTWYTSYANYEVFTEAFTEEYGIQVNTYRGTVNEIVQRVIQESAAGSPQADVIQMNNNGIFPLVDEGLLAEYDQDDPVLEPLPEEFKDEANWVWGQQTAIPAAFNTDLVSGGGPTTWEELLTEYAGKAGWEPRSHYTFGVLVQDYFVGELGYTEAEAVDLFKQAARGAVAVQGNPTLFQFLQSGEVPVIMHTYTKYIEDAEANGAPVVQAPITPIPVQPSALALAGETDSPASAVLWFDWWLSAGQQIVADEGTWTANPEYATEGQKQYQDDTLEVSQEFLVGEPSEKWKSLYEEVIAEVGETVAD